MSTLQTDPPGALEKREAESLRELTPQQWKSGLAAWLGWFFDGLDMHIYTIVAAPFVAHLLNIADTTNLAVREKSSWIQAAFLIGWALGGGFFGRIGDRLGRSRALALTILTYAIFTGLSFFATRWWHLLIFRFLAALGIGGEWAVGSSLLSETWPRRWRAWISAVLQSGVNLGILLASLATYLLAAFPHKYVFLVGIIPAFIVYWIRRHVPEPAEWKDARELQTSMPGVADLFVGRLRRITLFTIGVCGCSLTGWWAFMFWNPQQMRNLPDVAHWGTADKERLVSFAFFIVVGASIFGTFFAAWLARVIGYRKAIAAMCLGLLVTFCITYFKPRDHISMLLWLPWIGLFSGVFGLFTMYLPPLFPVLLRTTGAGFSYNIGRIAAAAGTVFFGLFANVGDFRIALLLNGLLFIPAMLFALMLPDARDQDY
jgi:MFS family permease